MLFQTRRDEFVNTPGVFSKTKLGLFSKQVKIIQYTSPACSTLKFLCGWSQTKLELFASLLLAQSLVAADWKASDVQRLLFQVEGLEVAW